MPLIKGLSDTQRVNDLVVGIHGTLCFDIGANAGYLANIFAKSFETVIAFEPATESYTYLERDAAPNVKPLQMAVSDHKGEVVLYETAATHMTGMLSSENGINGFDWTHIEGERTIPCDTLDNLALKYGTPDFVKVDTEGHESRIVEGGYDVFKEHPQFVIEIHEYNQGKAIQEYFNGLGIVYEKVRHHYRAGSPNYINHYWLVNVWE